MTVLEVLKAARELIADESRWTQKTYARDADGNAVDWALTCAHSFCMLGAIRHVTGRPIGHGPVFAAIERACGVEYVVDFNDSHTHAEVLALFDAAIARLEAP